MPFDLNKLLVDGDQIKPMPAITISNRSTDKRVTYNSNLTRLDRIAGDIYDDETYWKIILWANPAYYLEFDIPNNTVIRVPFPLNDVLKEVTNQIIDSTR